MHGIAIMMLLALVVQKAVSKELVANIDSAVTQQVNDVGDSLVDHLVNEIYDRAHQTLPKQRIGLDVSTLGKSVHPGGSRGHPAELLRSRLRAASSGHQAPGSIPSGFLASSVLDQGAVRSPLLKPLLRPNVGHPDPERELHEDYFTAALLGVQPQVRVRSWLKGRHKVRGGPTTKVMPTRSKAHSEATVVTQRPRNQLSALQALAKRSLQDTVRRTTPSRVTELSAAANILLAVFKIGAGTLAGSAALVADGVHSVSDVLSDAVCWVSVQIGSRPADASHPQGYSHYEHVGSLGIAALMIITGVAMTIHSGSAILSILGTTAAPVAAKAALELLPLFVALGSVATKELLYRFTFAVGTHSQSPSTIANAHHQRADALSSLVACVGISGTLIGVPWLDSVAAFVVGVMMTIVGVGIGHESGTAIHGLSVSSYPDRPFHFKPA